MSSKAKGIIISIIAILVIVFVILGAFRLVDYLSWETYSSARKQCESFLEKHRVKMEEIALDALASSAEISGDYKGHYYSNDIENGFVQFDIDAQGMLGGQYWCLVYSKDGLYEKCVDSYYSLWQGNNVTKGERLEGNWWYIWYDYDNTDRSYE